MHKCTVKCIFCRYMECLSDYLVGNLNLILARLPHITHLRFLGNVILYYEHCTNILYIASTKSTEHKMFLMSVMSCNSHDRGVYRIIPKIWPYFAFVNIIFNLSFWLFMPKLNVTSMQCRILSFFGGNLFVRRRNTWANLQCTQLLVTVEISNALHIDSFCHYLNSFTSSM